MHLWGRILLRRGGRERFLWAHWMRGHAELWAAVMHVLISFYFQGQWERGSGLISSEGMRVEQTGWGEGVSWMPRPWLVLQRVLQPLCSMGLWCLQGVRMCQTHLLALWLFSVWCPCPADCSFPALVARFVCQRDNLLSVRSVFFPVGALLFFCLLSHFCLFMWIMVTMNQLS